MVCQGGNITLKTHGFQTFPLFGSPVAKTTGNYEFPKTFKNIQKYP